MEENNGKGLDERKRVYSRKSRYSTQKGWRRFFNRKWILLTLITTLLLVVGGCSAIMMSAKSLPLDRLNEIDVASTVYDVNGKPVTKLGSINKEYVKMEDVKSRKLIEETFISVEDRRFYEHNGVDFRSILRAVVTNVMEGRKAQGGGTITMQLARNVILENKSKTYLRKLKEVGTAWNLERKYSKEEILEAYLNFIYFGNDVQGISMASKIYFDKDLTKQKLEPHEAALLAALPKAPSLYNPYRNEEKAKERRNLVLRLMERQGVLSTEEKEKYQAMDLGVNRKYLKKHLKKERYTAYKHYIMEEAEERFQLSETELATGGYKIYTHLVPHAQRAIEKAFDNDDLFQNQKQLDGGATIVNPRTGGLVAIAGGREYKGQGYMLRSKEEKRQPGSAIKPITVYAPAVQEKGYNEYSPVPDPPGFHIQDWRPKNFQRRYYDRLPLKDVLAKSLNVATAWLLKNEVGLGTASDYAQRMGLELVEKDRHSHAALALGGLTKGVNTVQMAQAYSAFANNGKLTDVHGIRKISTANEDREWVTEETIQKDQQVLTPKTAYYLTRMLHYNVRQGTGKNAQLPDGRDVAGKTGTTQGSKEAWFVGYTQEYVMSAMVFNQNDGKVELSGGKYPARIFRSVMSEALKGTPVSRFTNPGVPEPKPPFKLRPVDLSASFDKEKEVVQLKWNDYADRLKYRVERSEDGQNWKPIGETQAGGFTDPNIVLPRPESAPLDEIFGRRTSVYHYRVIAVDQVENQEAEPSNTVTLEIHPSENPPPENPEEGDSPGEDEAPNGDQQGEPPGDQEGEQQGDQQGEQQGDQQGDQQNDQQGDQGESQGTDPSGDAVGNDSIGERSSWLWKNGSGFNFLYRWIID
ncbi:transglycosylase domain-containing protein [Melghirimyces algeriensis]|uniref:Penicillin-binding protein 2A n=1 Tax=Melghirimyces algeriensis TaxID=910412 RepID=A0A521DPC6_9BACL|nr:transglycosylase domain-containing protein [Melghirimyces algeriensis]SMO73579.1 penicillin-binding protein 2A [Melghirimyces algeriensis]